MQDIKLEEEFAQTSLDRRTAAKLLVFLRPYMKPYIAVILLEFFWVSLVLAGPALVQRGLDDYIPHRKKTLLIGACLIYGATYFFRWIIVILQIRLNQRAGKRFLNDLRKAIFTHLQRLSMNYYDRTKHGRILARADRDVDQLEYPFVWGPVIIVSSLLSLVMSSFIMARYNLKLFGAILLLIPIMAVASEIFRKKGMAAYRKVRESLAVVTAALAENISGVRVVQAFCREPRNLSVFWEIVRSHKRNVESANTVWNTFYPIIMMLNAAAAVIAIIYGGYLINSGEMTVGKVSAFVLYVGMFFGPILELSDLYNGMLSGASAAERIFLLLDTEPSVKNTPHARSLTDITGNVGFENVHFRYGAEGPWILQDVSFSIKPGETVALVGATGAGKTSIASLVARFYEAQTGCVAIDGNRVEDITLECLHARLGIVLQDNFLFSGTVMENLRFGRPGATDEELIDVAKQLGTHEIFKNLADGYRTKVKEQGRGLSLGERQLICFTRAFAADPRILILDEATSAVDARTEAVLQSALGKLLDNRTSLVIAHRLSTIRNADRILVLDKGRIVEYGDHEDLVRRKGMYFSMYEEYVRSN
jgi:ABC-type multidrug transport system fused ATPase/permease subunit